MSAPIADELARLRHNQAVLVAALNRLIADTAPAVLVNPKDGSSGYVTTGLMMDAQGMIVPGAIPVADPHGTLRGVRPGDPLWVEPVGSP